ncbi:ComF family protein [Adlercreutzia equolifaciens]|uniref:ComF family protein n=1 Tax=Adlercreutzia equolifaciens TaxID=446660 RepID=UPI003AF99C36
MALFDERKPAKSRREGAAAKHAAPSRRLRADWRAVRDFAADMVTETLYPTRCAVCDKPGAVLCGSCAAALPYIDALTACPRCGAPFGVVQCSECTSVLMEPFGYKEPPYDEMASALVLTEAVRRIVTVYKDQNERGLARPMAQIMARYLPPRWMGAAPVVTFVPATAAARRRRGFDHAEHLARELSFIAGLDFAPLLVAARSRDQRKLGRTGRIGNMRHSLTALAGASMPGAVIVVDDVCTTGATLFAATEALRAAGAKIVWCLTFART